LLNALKFQHESLMRKLAVLDNLAGVDEETKAKRKSLVGKVSSMLDEIDNLLKQIQEALEKQESNKKLLVNPTGKGIRNDSGGLGHFGAPRGIDSKGEKRFHEGLDISAIVGQDVVAPFDGKVKNMIGNVTKKPMVQIYPTNTTFPFERLEILYVDKLEEIQWGVFRYVQAGDIIGTAANLGKWYSSKVGNHIHVQIFKKDGINRIDPKPFFFKD